VRTALTDLGFGCRVLPPDRYVVRSPYWRMDVTMADDIVEEIARATGYDRIEPEALEGALPEPVDTPLRDLRERLRDAAVAAGFQETISYPLTTTETLAVIAPKDELDMHPPLRLENPMSSEQVVMRSSLRASALATAAQNQRFERGTVAVFESARAYISREGDLPEEREKVAGVVAGHRLGRWGEPTSETVDFYDAKGLVENIFERIGLEPEWRPAEEQGLLRGRTAALLLDGEEVGVLGEVHPSTSARFEVQDPAFLFDIDVQAVLDRLSSGPRHKPLSRFPEVLQDMAIVVKKDVPAAKVGEAIGAHQLVRDARLFDVYEGPSLAPDMRSLAFEVHFQAPDRTLTDAEVADARRRIIRRLEHELGAELRS